MKRKLVSKGGVRREKLPLYVGEYVWRYNHRNKNENVKVKRIIKLLEHEVNRLNVTIPKSKQRLVNNAMIRYCQSVLNYRIVLIEDSNNRKKKTL